MVVRFHGCVKRPLSGAFFRGEDIMMPISDFGELMTLAEFDECVQDGTLIDYDGYGYLCTETEESNIQVYPSNWENIKKNIPAQLTHIIWFNR